MPTIVRLSGPVRLCMDAGDRRPPPFNVMTGGGNAFMVRLDTPHAMAGSSGPEALRLAADGARANAALPAARRSEIDG